MRIPEYMSPTSLKAFESNRDEFYLRYLADHKPPRFPQTKPMSVGSAFDAYCKSFLHFHLFGNYGPNNEYEKDSIFVAQVEEHNRDWAREAGENAFQLYKKSGALSDLMIELSTAVNDPRFEFSIQSFVEGQTGAVPLLGKPDIYFINGQGCRVILDWKVNGYCAKKMTSPNYGYVMVRDSWLPSERKPSTRNRLPHKDCCPSDFKGVQINKNIWMEQVNEEWAAQLSTYAWLLGEEVGSDLVLGIEQLCGYPVDDMPRPLLRCASHRCRASFDFQINLHQRYVSAWTAIQEDTVVPPERKVQLEEMAKTLATADPNSFESLVYQMARS